MVLYSNDAHVLYFIIIIYFTVCIRSDVGVYSQTQTPSLNGRWFGNTSLYCVWALSTPGMFVFSIIKPCYFNLFSFFNYSKVGEKFDL